MKRTKHFLDVTKVTGHTGLTTYVVTLDGNVVDEYLTRSEATDKMNQLASSMRTK